LRVRVINPSGAVAEIDPSQITEKAVTDSLRRELDVQLPALVVGSVVEQEVVTADREPMLGGGDMELANVVDEVPVVSLRAIFEAPVKRKLHIVVHGTLPNRQRTAGLQAR
jgi:hypothetical protein